MSAMPSSKRTSLTWWLTGLPAAGKSTLANGLKAHFAEQGKSLVILDGDELRAGLCSDLGFSPEDRHENIRRVAQIAKLLNDSGISVVVALVSPFKKSRAMARQIIGTHRFIESFVCADLAICSVRDPKGLYARAHMDPQFALTGLNAPYESPEAPEVVALTAYTPVERCVDLLVDAGAKKLLEASP